DHSRTHVDERLRSYLVAGHARDRVALTNQCGDQWLADRSTRTGNKDVHMQCSWLTCVVCTARRTLSLTHAATCVAMAPMTVPRVSVTTSRAAERTKE